jgi:ketosteroid isomerase-like protein
VKSLFAASLLAVAAPAPPPAPASVASLVETERAFAQLAQDKGTQAAFGAFIGEDGQMFLPAPTRAKPLIEAGKIDFGPIRWWPVYAGVAASGDLGFTTGPAISGEGKETRYAVFLTVWKRQPDGRWRFIMDKGIPQALPSPQDKDAPVAALPASRAGKGAKGWDEVAAAEAVLSRGLAVDAPKAFLAALAPDGRLLRNGPPPATTAIAVRAILAAGPTRIAAAPLGGAASAAGDLAYTYGTAAWRDASGDRNGHYLRLWQRRAGGWRLVVDQATAPPAAPPPTPAPTPPSAGG